MGNLALDAELAKLTDHMSSFCKASRAENTVMLLIHSVNGVFHITLQTLCHFLMFMFLCI